MLLLMSVIPGLWLLQVDLYFTRIEYRDANGLEECGDVVTNATGLRNIQGVRFLFVFVIKSFIEISLSLKSHSHASLKIVCKFYPWPVSATDTPIKASYSMKKASCPSCFWYAFNRAT